MGDVYDICKSIKSNSLHFVLNPNDCWHTFNSKFTTVVSSDWKEIKFLNKDCTKINEQIRTVPNNAGGIYIFYLHPDIIPCIHKYILYVGRVKYTSNQNLRKRFREYVSDTRSDIEFMRETWGSNLYIKYLPLIDNDLIEKLEKELIRTIIPPCNTDYPGTLNKAMKAAFI